MRTPSLTVDLMMDASGQSVVVRGGRNGSRVKIFEATIGLPRHSLSMGLRGRTHYGATHLMVRLGTQNRYQAKHWAGSSHTRRWRDTKS